MRDKTLDIAGEEDLFAFLDWIQNIFLLDLDTDQVLCCKSVGEFERFVYDEIQANSSVFHDSDHMYTRLIQKINSSVIDRVDSPIEEADLDKKISVIAKEHASESWELRCYEMNQVFGVHGIEIKSPRWALWFVNVLGVAFFVGAFAIGIMHGFLWGIGALVMVFAALSAVESMIPSKTLDSEPTLRERMDDHIAMLAKRQQELSVMEVQHYIRNGYARWMKIDDVELINSESPFPQFPGT